MKWVNGTVYEGNWVNGVQQGEGKLTMPDGNVKEGNFQNNVFIDKVGTDIDQEKSEEEIKENNVMKDSVDEIWKMVLANRNIALQYQSNLPSIIKRTSRNASSTI